MSDDSYTPPSDLEARNILHKLGLTGAAAAVMVGFVGGRASSRQFRRYTAGDSSMPFSVLYTIVSRSIGKSVTPGGWRRELEEIWRKT